MTSGCRFSCHVCQIFVKIFPYSKLAIIHFNCLSLKNSCNNNTENRVMLFIRVYMRLATSLRIPYKKTLADNFPDQIIWAIFKQLFVLLCKYFPTTDPPPPTGIALHGVDNNMTFFRERCVTTTIVFNIISNRYSMNVCASAGI